MSNIYFKRPELWHATEEVHLKLTRGHWLLDRARLQLAERSSNLKRKLFTDCLTSKKIMNMILRKLIVFFKILRKAHLSDLLHGMFLMEVHHSRVADVFKAKLATFTLLKKCLRLN